MLRSNCAPKKRNGSISNLLLAEMDQLSRIGGAKAERWLTFSGCLLFDLSGASEDQNSENYLLHLVASSL